MSHKNKVSLIGQADARLQKMTQAGVGRSKHQDKIDDVDYKYIYTWKTYQAYIKHCCYFLDWCKENHGCKTLKQCRQYVPEWIKSRRGLSASTQKLDVAALSKLYRCHHSRGQKPFKDVETDTRRRANIKRSRGDAVRDKHFSEKNNADLITFCKCSGLRLRTAMRGRGYMCIVAQKAVGYAGSISLVAKTRLLYVAILCLKVMD